MSQTASSIPIPESVDPSWLGDLTKKNVKNWAWAYFIYFVLLPDPAFHALVEYRDDVGKYVVPGKANFLAKLEEVYAGRRSFSWDQIVKSMRASGWDCNATQNGFEFVHVFGFGVGETIQTFFANHSAHDKAVKKVRRTFHSFMHAFIHTVHASNRNPHQRIRFHPSRATFA